jgi:hypothetical protein
MDFRGRIMIMLMSVCIYVRCEMYCIEGSGLFVASELCWFALGLGCIVLYRDTALSLESWFGMR